MNNIIPDQINFIKRTLKRPAANAPGAPGASRGLIFYTLFNFVHITVERQRIKHLWSFRQNSRLPNRSSLSSLVPG